MWDILEKSVGREYAVVTVAMRSGRWDEGCDFVDQFQRGEHQIARAIGTWLGVVINQMFVIQYTNSRPHQRSFLPSNFVILLRDKEAHI